MGEAFPGIQPSEKISEERLDSWKEIAAYLNRDVTTVQRWEKREGMPVHRHLHDKRGSVYALSSELDAWVQSRKFSDEHKKEEQKEPPDGSMGTLDTGRNPSQFATPAAGQVFANPSRRSFRYAALTALVVVAICTWSWHEWRRGEATRANLAIHSLAVLPLQNLSGDPSQDYFADGMTEELIGRLSRIRGLGVISRTSAMHFKNTKMSLPEIARALGVDAIVEGSIVREGRQVRVHVQLIRAATDEHIWAEEYQREYLGILEVQDEVTRSIAEQVAVALTPEERVRLASRQTVDPEAHENYLKGLYYFNQRTEDGLSKSIVSFEKAVAEDPKYALAYSGLADAYAMLGFRGAFPSKDALSQAKSSALKAIQLDGTLAEPHVSLAFIAETHEWDWPTAEREYQRALELDPGDARAHNWYAGYLTYVGRLDDGISEARRARDLDPLSLPINNALAGRLLAAGHNSEALQQVQRTLELDRYFAPAHQTLGWIYLHSGKQDDAIREFQDALKLSGSNDTDLLLDLGFAYALSGRRNQAGIILGKLEKLHQQGAVPAASIGILHGALGESNQAFAWLEKACDERDPQLTYIKTGRRFEPLRNDPRFDQLVRRVGLPD
jgi:TolB-like protein/Tfp pilus assembly protein PilF